MLYFNNMVERDHSGFGQQPMPYQHPNSIANISYYSGPGNLDLIASGFGGGEDPAEMNFSAA